MKFIKEVSREGVKSDLIYRGLEAAVANYCLAVDLHGLDELDNPSPDVQWRKDFSATNADAKIPEALVLTEDSEEIMRRKEWIAEYAKGFAEKQYAIDHYIGNRVAKYLWDAINTKSARDLLPKRTVALLEVNANRGFDRGDENKDGCYGMPQNYLGYVGVDTYYSGTQAVNSEGGNTLIDYLGESDAVDKFSESLERNAARIRIRPAHPLTTRVSMAPGWRMYDGPRGMLIARQTATVNGVFADNFKPGNSAFLSGQYRVIRAVAVLDDPNSWEPNEFAQSKDLKIL